VGERETGVSAELYIIHSVRGFITTLYLYICIVSKSTYTQYSTIILLYCVPYTVNARKATIVVRFNIIVFRRDIEIFMYNRKTYA